MPASSRGLSGLSQLDGAEGVIAYTVDPVSVVSSHQATTGVIHGVGVWLPARMSVTYLSTFIVTAGANLTHAQLGLYDSAFALVASTADSPTTFQSTGWGELALSGGPYVTPAAGIYYLADVFVGGTQPFYKATGQTASPHHALSPGGVFIYWQQTGPLNALPNPAVPVTSSVAHLMACR